MNTTNLSKRLFAAAKYVRPSAAVADVGTDHAYLPIALVDSGIAARAVASDINEGPYLRAKENVARAGLESKIATLCTPGLCGIEKFCPSDILICGMGGELIASIIDDAPFTKTLGIRLILQPMTHPEILRGYLLEHGYDIVGESLVKEDKIYQIICAEYTGKTTLDYSPAELLVGRLNIREASDTLSELLTKQIEILKKIVLGKRGGNADSTAQLELIKSLEEIKNDCK